MQTIHADYKVYYDDFPRALQLAKFYLKEWGKIDKDITSLSDEEKEFAIKLYSTLKNLTEYERKILGDKYRVDIYKKYSKPDKELAAEYDMAFYEYRKLRKGIEYKFFHYLREHIPSVLNAGGYYE